MGQWIPAKGAKGFGGEAGEGVWLSNEEIRVSWTGCTALCCSCFPIACVNSWLIGGKEKGEKKKKRRKKKEENNRKKEKRHRRRPLRQGGERVPPCLFFSAQSRRGTGCCCFKELPETKTAHREIPPLLSQGHVRGWRVAPWFCFFGFVLFF